MRPVLFAWRGVRIHSYPAMLYVGMVLGIAAGNIAANAAGLASARVWAAMILLIIPGLAGSRLLWVAIHWPHYHSQPRRIWRRSEGGQSMLGGLVLMLAVSVPLLWAMDLSYVHFWDAATFVMLVGMIFTRLGCLLNGCCSGRETAGPCGLHLPDHQGVWKRRIPTQLIEMGLGVVVLALATWVWGRSQFPGAVVLSSVAAYSTGRFVLEPLRDRPDRVGAINVQQALAGVLAVLALIGLAWSWLNNS